MLIVILFFLGLCAGSFVNALVWRLHEGKNWISGRSQCPNCDHPLSVRDLLPVVSWLSLKGRCRYCQAPIANHYPLIELLGGVWFASSFAAWPNLSSHGQLTLLITWLIVSVGLLALLLYDHLWMILPSKIIYSSLLFAVAGRLAYIFGWSGQVSHGLAMWALSVLIASGIFFVLHEVSHGQWIGFGDVRLGLVTGTVLASPSLSTLMIFISSLIGVLAALPALFRRRRTLNERLPFGPFLIFATYITVLWGTRILDWYYHFWQAR